MRRVVTCLAFLVAASFALSAQSSLPLVQPGQLIWKGAFRLPYPNTGNSDIGYSGWAIAYHAASNSLYLVGHEGKYAPKTDPANQAVAEFSIPAGISPTKTTLAQLPIATQIQPFASMTHGLALDAIGASSSGNFRFGGLLAHNGRLILGEYNSYTARGTIQKSHWTHSLTTTDAATNATGPWKLEPASFDPAMVGGYMAAVPTVFQSLLGGPALTGQCCQSLIQRTSYGPSAFAFDPAKLGTVPEPVPTTPLVYYDELHQQPDGQFDSDNTNFFNGSTQMAGMFIPEGTRSLLFVGRHGTGDMCYNNGTNSGPNNCLNTPPDPYCGDIIHAWPYQVQVWAYDLNDLAAVKAGSRQPWSVRPYAIWPLTGNETAIKLPFFPSCMRARALAFDPATNRAFLVSPNADGDRPVIHVFEVSTVAPPPPPPPPPACTVGVSPTSLTIGAAGGPLTVQVTASDSTCGWTATGSSGLVVSPTSGTGSGSVTLTVSANTSTSARTLSATVAGVAVSVAQDGAAPPPPPPSGGYATDWATYQGGTQDDYNQHVAVDGAGNVYVVGGSFGSFPGTSACNGAQDGIIVKLSPTGQRLWSRCIGGTAKDYIHTVAVDSQGVYVSGVTWSSNFPVTAGVFQTVHKGTKDNFVAKFDLNGTKLWATYLGGSGDEHDRANLTVDSAHNVWVAGSTASSDFPTTAGAYSRTYAGGTGNDGYIVQLSANGSAVLRGTYIGGTGNDDLIAGVRIGTDGSVYAAGITNSTNLPTTTGAFRSVYQGGAIDGFVVRFDATLASRIFVTYMGGSGDDTVSENHGFTIDASGRPVVMGQTTSANLPASATAFQRTLRGGIDVYAAVLSANGQSLQTLSYLGGTGTDLASGVGVDGSGQVYVVGYTQSTNFPVQSATQPTFQGVQDGTLAVFDSTLSSLVFATYVGGSGDDRSRSVALGASGAIVVAGDTNSTNFPTKNPSQATLAGPEDYQVTVFVPSAPPPPPCAFTVSPTSTSVPAVGGSVQIAVTASASTCAWTATATSWASVAPGSGTGNGTVTVTVPAQTAPSPRTTSVMVAGQAVSVTQDAAVCSFVVSPTALSIPAAGGSASLTITASDPACGWTLASSLNWLTPSATSGTGSATVTFTAPPLERSGSIDLAGQAVTVEQR